MLPSTRKPISVSRRAPKMPPLQLLDEIGNQPFKRLHRGFRMRRRLFQLEQCAAVVAQWEQRLAVRACGLALGRGRRPGCPPRGNGGRGNAARSPPGADGFHPSRSSVRVASGGNRNAATGRSASFAPVSLPQITAAALP